MGDLSDQQSVFIDEYLDCLNAAEAARRAGYSRKTARQQGSHLLTNPDIRAEVDRRLAERAMSSEEVLARLSEQAHSDIADLLSAQGIPDLKKAKREGKSHLIKKLKRTTRTDKNGDVVVEIELELYDAQAALVHLGKYHKLFTERHEHSGKVEVDARERLTRLLDSLDAESGAADAAGGLKPGGS